MSRIAFWFIVFSLLPFTIVAQPDSLGHLPKPIVSTTAGLGLSPEGLFNPSSNTQWADFIKPGYNVNISGQLPLFHSHFGVRASFGYYRNSFDMSKFVSQVESAIPNSTVTSIDYGAFTQYAALAGAFGSFNYGKTATDIWLECGAEYVSLPNTEMNIVVSSPGQSNWNSTVVYSTKAGFAFSSGVAQSFYLTKSLWLTVAAGYLFTNIGYSGTKYDVYIQHIQYTTSVSGAANISMVSINAGLRYVFKSKNK